ncbi:MAG: MBL fold metallo-hydrolase [Acholeplasmatales bacterium]|nr:MBL fold metallo-hydrolase [Acholeplasmatales bacterium]
MKRINDYISYLESTDNPLSARVFIINGKEYNYIFDVGANKESREIIKNIENRKIIISHFHTDHMENLRFFIEDVDNLYIGDYTYKILGYGNVIKEELEISDGIDLKIIPIPNSHSKGALCLLINEEYLLIGDSLEGNRYGLNQNSLKDEIALLEKLNFKYILTGHESEIYLKDDVIKTLKYYYSKRDNKKPYIGYDML